MKVVLGFPHGPTGNHVFKLPNLLLAKNIDFFPACLWHYSLNLTHFALSAYQLSPEILWPTKSTHTDPYWPNF